MMNPSKDVRRQWKIPWYKMQYQKWSIIVVIVSLVYTAIAVSLLKTQRQHTLLMTESYGTLFNANDWKVHEVGLSEYDTIDLSVRRRFDKCIREHSSVDKQMDIVIRFLMLIEMMRWSKIVRDLSTAGSDMIEQREMILGLRDYEAVKLNLTIMLENVGIYLYESSNLEAVYRVVSFKKVVLSRQYEVNLRKLYNYGQINRMLVYLVQFVISGESNRCELKDSKV